MKELCAKFHCASRSMGMERIEHPLFYRVPIALRFEIGDPAPTVPIYLPDGRANQQYIESAFHRASTLFRSLPDTWDILRFDCYEGENFQELLKIVRAVTGLPAPHESASSFERSDRSRYWWTQCLGVLCVLDEYARFDFVPSL